MLVRLRRRLEPRLLTAKLMSESAGYEGELRENALASVASLESRLSGVRRKVPASDRLRRIDSARRRLQGLAQDSAQTRGLLDDAESKEIGEIKREVDFQRRMVRDLGGEGVSIAADNEKVSTPVGGQPPASLSQPGGWMPGPQPHTPLYSPSASGRRRSRTGRAIPSR